MSQLASHARATAVIDAVHMILVSVSPSAGGSSSEAAGLVHGRLGVGGNKVYVIAATVLLANVKYANLHGHRMNSMLANPTSSARSFRSMNDCLSAPVNASYLCL